LPETPTRGITIRLIKFAILTRLWQSHRFSSSLLELPVCGNLIGLVQVFQSHPFVAISSVLPKFDIVTRSWQSHRFRSSLLESPVCRKLIRFGQA
jgi:hypothetical protein